MFILLLLVWIIFNERVTFEVMWLGCLISACVTLFTVKFMDYDIKKEIKLLKKLPLFCLYLYNLVIEIFKSTWTTIELILFEDEVEPALYTFTNTYKTNVGKTLKANSITLTPGTITVEYGDEFKVHCLDKSLVDGMDENSISKIVKEMEAKDE